MGEKRRIYASERFRPGNPDWHLTLSRRCGRFLYIVQSMGARTPASMLKTCARERARIAMVVLFLERRLAGKFALETSDYYMGK